MEKLSEEKYLTNCEEFEQHNVMYRQMVFTYAKGKNHLMYKTFEEAK